MGLLADQRQVGEVGDGLLQHPADDVLRLGGQRARDGRGGHGVSPPSGRLPAAHGRSNQGVARFLPGHAEMRPTMGEAALDPAAPERSRSVPVSTAHAGVNGFGSP
ncbi:hypothetical protein Acsp07_24910 [Actinomycetospora sp. NBRC 106378]|nr:hypothetical protein Acsp07_24910 [Actinomycetospora sp. NBRC 106378]